MARPSMWDVVSGWTDNQLDRLLEALKRDRSLTVKQLSEFVRPKSVTEVNELVSLLLEVSEQEIIGAPEPNGPQTVIPESMTDVLIQTTRHITLDELSFSTSVGQVLDQHAKWLVEQERSASKANIKITPGSNYSQLYEFLAALMLNRPLPCLDEISCAVMLDLISSLSQVITIVREEDAGFSIANSELNNLRNAFQAASRKITDSVGIYIAAAASIQLSALLNTTKDGWSDDILRTLPVAPFFVLRDVQRTKSLKASRELQQVLLRKFCEVWELPEIADNLNSLSISMSPNNAMFGHLVKSMSMFTLNPFLLPKSVINPFQNVLSQLCRATCPRPVGESELISFFSPILRSNLSVESETSDHREDEITPSYQQCRTKRTHANTSLEVESGSSSKRPRRSKKPRTSKNQDTNTQPQQSTEVQSDGAPPSVLSSPPPATTCSNPRFFRRLPEENEVYINRATYRKYFLVRDTYDRKPQS